MNLPFHIFMYAQMIVKTRCGFRSAQKRKVMIESPPWATFTCLLAFPTIITPSLGHKEYHRSYNMKKGVQKMNKLSEKGRISELFDYSGIISMYYGYILEFRYRNFGSYRCILNGYI